MRFSLIPTLALFLGLTILTSTDAHAASKQLSPGTYSLRVLISQGQWKGTTLTGRCVVKGKTATYTIAIPFLGNVIAKGTVTKSGSFTIQQVGGNGRAVVSVKKATAKLADGSFNKVQAPLAAGTWTMSRL